MHTNSSQGDTIEHVCELKRWDGTEGVESLDSGIVWVEDMDIYNDSLIFIAGQSNNRAVILNISDVTAPVAISCQDLLFKNILVDAQHDRIYTSTWNTLGVYSLSQALSPDSTLPSQVRGFCQASLLWDTTLSDIIYDIIKGNDNLIWVGYGSHVGFLNGMDNFIDLGVLSLSPVCTAYRLTASTDRRNKRIYVGSEDGHMYAVFRDEFVNITSANSDSATEDYQYEYDATASSVDGIPPAIHFEHFPSWMDTSGAIISGIPTSGGYDTSFVVVATDGVSRDSVIVTLKITDILTGPIEGTKTLSRNVILTEDVLIDTNATLIINPGVNIYVYPDSDYHNIGKAASKVEIINHGRIYACGTPGDSIKFIPWGTSGSWSWYGIEDEKGKGDTLAYCAIRNGYTGYYSSSDGKTLLRHCEIATQRDYGIYLGGKHEHLAVIDSSIIKDCATGIYSTTSLFEAHYDTITNLGKWGIYVYYHPCEADTIQQSIIGNVITKGTGGATEGIYMAGGMIYCTPRAILKFNTIKHFSSCGVDLYKTATGAWPDSIGGIQFGDGNYIDSNGTYGLYCNQSSPSIVGGSSCYPGANSFSYNGSYGIYCTASSPRIRLSWLKDNKVSNVKYTSLSYPNLGDSVRFWGDNWFETYSGPSSTWDMYNSNNNTVQIKAMRNYWGEYTPDTYDFYPNASLVNYRHYYHYDPCLYSSGRVDAYGRLIPESFALHQNYPNPFNPSTNIAFDLPQPTRVRLCIYNVMGQRIKTLADQDFPAGAHELMWDGRNDRGGQVSTGVYFYLFETDGFRDTKKMVILK